MVTLKCILISCLLIFFTINTFSQTKDTKRLYLAIDGFAPAMKVGTEKKISERLSRKASAGICIVAPSIISYNFFYTYKITKPERALGINLNFGFLDNYIVITLPMFSLGLGGGAGAYYRFKNCSTLTFRLGMIAGPSLENNELSILTLPNFGIEYACSLNFSRKEK